MTATSPALPRTTILVVSLEASAERRAVFERHAAAAGTALPWRFFAAHTALAGDLIYRERDAVLARGRALYPRELACYSSHYAAWASLRDGEADQLLVVEDDVVLDWAFVAELCAHDLAAAGVHYLKLFNKNITPFRLLSDRFLRRSLIDCRGYAHGMQAYMLTRVGAARFIEHCRTIRRPIDDEMDRSWAHGLPNLAVFPFPAFELHGPSTIGLSRYESHALPLKQRLPRTAVRLAEKLRRARQAMTGFGRQTQLPVFAAPAGAGP